MRSMAFLVAVLADRRALGRGVPSVAGTNAPARRRDRQGMHENGQKARQILSFRETYPYRRGFTHVVGVVSQKLNIFLCFYSKPVLELLAAQTYIYNI